MAIIEYDAAGSGGQSSSSTWMGSEAPLRLAPDMDVGCRRLPSTRWRQEIAVPCDRRRRCGRLRDERRRDGHPAAPGSGSEPTMDRPRGEYGLLGRRCAALLSELRPASGGLPEGCCQLWVMNADGTDPHAFGSVTETAWTGVPTVSPDGRWVSYWSVLGDSGNQQIRVAPADGSGPAIGTGPAMSDFFPWAWSPDSSKILMMPEDGSTTSAYLIDPEGGPWSTVPFEIWLGPRLAAPGALSFVAPRASAGCSPSERSVGRCHGPVTGRE